PDQPLSEGVMRAGLMGAAFAPFFGGAQAQRIRSRGQPALTDLDIQKMADRLGGTITVGGETYTPRPLRTYSRDELARLGAEAETPGHSPTPEGLEGMTEEQLAAAFPDLVRTDAGLPSRAEQVRRGDEWAKRAADAAEGIQPEQAQEEAAPQPNVLDETVARIEKDHPGQGEVIRPMMGMEKGEFVRVKVPVDLFDVQSIVDEAKSGNAEINPTKVRQYAALNTEAPEVAAITSPADKNKLFAV